MDPVSALGAAAAGAQFVGLAVKTLLGAAKLFQGIKEDPKRAVELLTWIEEELNSMQRLLHPDSPVFASLTTSQYVQVAPSAINARKALEKVRTVLSPLVQDIDRLKAQGSSGRKIILLWKSLFTMKMMKDIEKNLETIRMLNATLLRELQICGFETQSLLRDQSVQVLSIVVELSKRDDELLKSMEQLGSLQSQTLEVTNLSTNALLQTLDTMREAENRRYQELLRMQQVLTQAIQDMPSAKLISIEKSKVPAGTEDEFRLNNLESTSDSTQIVGHKPKISKALRCKCYMNKHSSIHIFRPFIIKTDSQAVQFCPLHGWSGQRSYSIAANLHPWTYGSLQLSLGVLFQGRTWSISRPLNFQGTVRRSDSPIFRLFDEFVSSCSTAKVIGGVNRGYLPLEPRDWDSQKTKAGLAGVVRGIDEAVSSGIASYSDMDERGCTLLTELTLLFAYLGEESFNVENELVHMFRIAHQSKLDPTTFNSGVSHGMNAPMSLGRTIFRHASMMGRISASLYEVFLSYEGLVEAASLQLQTFMSFEWRHLWTAVVSDPSLADALGYDTLSLAVISRSLERLKKIVHATPRYHPRKGPTYEPLALAVGWPEGLQLLIDNDYGDFVQAFNLACEIHDVKSAALLVSASKRVLLIRPLFAKGSYPEDHVGIVDTLRAASRDKRIFQLTAEELWRQKTQLKLMLLDPSSSCYNPDMWLAVSETATSDINYDEVYTVWSPGKLQSLDNIISSATHCVTGLKAYQHQILFNAGFTDIDTWCETLGTPLSHKCLMAYPKFSEQTLPKDFEPWGRSVLWLLRKGANPRIFSKHSGYHGIFVHHFLAQAQKAGMKLGKSFSKLLGYHHERNLHDGCKCLCSSMGCIPSHRFWRHSITIGERGEVDKRVVAHRLPSIHKWIRFWRYSGKDAEFIYRELCRHEVFERLEMAHLCCERKGPGPMSLFGSPRDTAMEDRRQDIEMEDENSARNLRLLLQFYILVRKEYSKISIGVFWNFWWDNLDALLPPLETPTIHFPFDTWEYEYKAFRDDLDISRDGKWRATLEEAGYKDWDYQDVIRDHCTKILLKARAHRQRVAVWKQHRLVSKPRFGRRQPFKFLRKEPEECWD